MRSGSVLRSVALVVLVSGSAAFAQDHGHDHRDAHGAAQAAGSKSVLQVPSSQQFEHKHLHEQLAQAIAAGGKTGEAAKVVRQHLSAHFAKEEQYAMKPLGLLAPLAKGERIDDAVAREAIEATDHLRKDYPEMLAEHQKIVEALDQLESAARAEDKPQQIEFAHSLKAHALNEEQVLYPAALLVGERLKAARAAHAK